MGMQLNTNTTTEPVGTVRMMIAATTADIPPGWLWCNGASLSTTQYPELFARIGYRYGGVGATFSLPDSRNKLPMCTNGTSGGYLQANPVGTWGYYNNFGSPMNLSLVEVDANLDGTVVEVFNGVAGQDPSLFRWMAYTFIIKAY